MDGRDAPYISFEEIEREHREERAEDARRLAAGEITPTRLQEENSIFPYGTKVRILNLFEHAQEAYDRPE